jgi:hypothetical protein
MTDVIFGDCSWKLGIEEVGLVEKLGNGVEEGKTP